MKTPGQNGEATRVQELLDASNFSKREFANYLGISHTVLTHFLNSRNKLGIQLLIAILEKYPDLNCRWLLFGEGEKYSNVNKTVAERLSVVEMENNYLKQQIADKEEIILHLKAQLKS